MKGGFLLEDQLINENKLDELRESLNNCLKPKKGKVNKSFNLKYNGDLLSEIIAIPVVERHIIDENTSRVEIEFAILIKGELDRQRVVCAINDMQKTLIDRIRNTFGLSWGFPSSKKLQLKYIELVESINVFLKREYTFETIGWNYYDEKKFYFTGNRVLFYEQDEDILPYEIVENENLSMFGLKVKKISPQVAFDRVFKMLEIAPKKVTIFMLLYFILSILKTPLKNEGIHHRFYFNTIGETNSMKTELSKLFFNPMVNNSLDVTSSFQGTKASIDYDLYLYKDSVVIFDDYYPPTTKEEFKRTQEKLTNIERSNSNDTYKKRMNSDMTPQKSIVTRSSPAITSEIMVSGESKVARAFSVTLTNKDVDREKFSESLKNINEYSTFVWYFLIWFMKFYDRNLQMMKKSFRRNRVNLSAIKSHGRLIDQVIQMNIASDLLLKFATDNGLMSLRGTETFKEEVNELLIDHLIKMNNELIMEKPIMMYFNALEDLISSNANVLIPFGTKTSNKGLIGWYDSNHYYLIGGVAYGAVKNYWHKQNIIFPKDMKTLHRELFEKDIIEGASDGNSMDFTIRKNVKGDSKERIRVVVVKKDVLDSYRKDLTEINISSFKLTDTFTKVYFKGVNEEKKSNKATFTLRENMKEEN